MKNVNLLFAFITVVIVFVLSYNAKGQTINNPWALYPHNVDLNSSPPEVSLLPGASASYNEPYWDANCAYSQNADLQFYLKDDQLYDSDGYNFGSLEFQFQGCGYRLPETNIVPVPGSNSSYYIVYARACTYEDDDLLYAIINCGENGCSIEENGSLITSYYDGNFTGIAISNLLPNNTRRMYISNYGQIQKFIIASAGISFSNTVYQNSNNPYLFDTYQLELSTDNTKLAWGGSVFNGNKLNIIALDQSGNFLNYTPIIVTDGEYNPSDFAQIVGVEFSIDVPRVYFSILGGTIASPFGGIFYYDFSSGTINNVVYDNYRYTHLQQDYNGFIYGVANDGTNLCQIDPSTNSFIPSYLSVNVYSNASVIGVSLYTLPDLIDYRNLMIETSSTPETCAAMSDGTATVSVVGGATPYTYQWDDLNAQTTATAVNLSPGSYTCVITDAVNNTISALVEVVTDPELFTHFGEWHIYVNETLSQLAKFEENIYVHNGGSLTISQQLEFNANKGITIHPGGMLTMTNSTTVSGLTVCNNNYWNGITIKADGIFNIGNNCTISKGDLILEAGASVVLIQKTLYLDDNMLIIKNQQEYPYICGAKFVLNGATLTTLNNYTWQGIEVWGDEDVAQLPDINGNYPQGFLELKNEAIIENNVLGIELWKPGDYTTTGGIIKAENTTFRNNAKPVRALYYHNTNPYNPSQELDYNGYFKNCSFEITEDYPGEATFYKHVDLNDVKGFRFEGCDFSVDPDAQGVSPYTSGISAYESGFSAIAYCTSQSTPCSAFDNCTFDGFNNAIYAAGGSSIYTFDVERAVFTNNNCGIDVLSVHNFSVLWSEFYIGHNSTDDDDCDGIGMTASGYGINSTASTGFAIEENYFTKATGAPTGTYTGIRVAETSAIDEIYLNEFENLSYGIYAKGKNWEGITFSQGLSLLCNDFAGSYRDIVVEKNPSFQGGIQSSQGNRAKPAGNEFINNSGDYKIYNNGNYPILYYYYVNSVSANPNPSYEVGPIGTGNTNNCSSHYGGGGDIETIILTNDEKLGLEQEYLTALNDYNNVKSLYDNLQDGGNTNALVNDVETAWPDETWELRADLLGKSPHLSLEVLKSAADKTEVLPESILFEILAANPDELRKEELIKYLADKENPLPGYMIDILRQVAYGTTYKTALQNQMAENNRLKTRAANDMIRSILNEEETDYDDLRNWLDNLGGVKADQQIIETYLAEGNVDNALELATVIPQLYQLSSYDLDEHAWYIELLDLKVDLLQQGRKYNELTGEEVAQLETLAQNSQGTAGTQARAILEQGYGHHFCDCLNITDEQGFKNAAINPALLNQALGVNCTVEPNPAREWAAFNYTLPGTEDKGVIKITDAAGKMVNVREVSGTWGQYVWDTREVKPGVYFYTFVVNGTGTTSKLVITK